MENNVDTGVFSDIQLKGNVIHTQWFQTIQKGGKADLLAINILAEIVYWYKPTQIRDEVTGQHLGYKKKYKADVLQKSYDSFATLFGVSKRQVQLAVVRLEELGVIKREFRTISQGNMLMNNVLFIHLSIEKLKEISYPPKEKDQPLSQNNVTPITKKCNTYHKNLSHLSQKNVTPVTRKRDTNTESTTESTTEREGQESTRPKTITKKSNPQKTKYGDFVKLTDSEHYKLCVEFGEAVAAEYIERVNNYVGSSGKRYKSHYHTIRTWLAKDNIKPGGQDKTGQSAQERLNAEMEEAKKILGLVD